MLNIASLQTNYDKSRALRGKRGSPNEIIENGIDFNIALVMLVFLSPLLLILCLIMLVFERGPILFRHRRIGRFGKPFYCFKLRSMAVDAEQRLEALLAADPIARAEWDRDHKLRKDPRVTPLGLFLRQSSLDELPQLLNVLRGEMSLVGPRPIVEAEIPRYGRRFRHYCALKPGITGLWQVSGRNDVSYRTRVAMDCLYARKKTPLMNLWLIGATVPAVLMRTGSY